jgi:predicted Rossmann fold flavoprotein
MLDVVIIGGGASGLAAGVIAKKRGKSVLVIEEKDRIGRKILATGNGKCNICNVDISNKWYNNNFIDNFLDRKDKFFAFFDNLGLKTKIVGDRIYPYSESANTVLNLLKNEFSENEILNDCKVDSLVKDKNCFVINGNIIAKNVVICTGSNATMGHNSHHLAVKMGHNVIECKPSLVSLLSDTTFTKRMANLRAKVELKLLDSRNEIVDIQKGEILFKDNGISGIAVFMLSSYIARNDGEYKVSVDFAPDLETTELEEFLNKNSIDGLLNSVIAEGIVKQAKAMNLPIFYVIKNFLIDKISLGSIKNAQVTCGGLDTAEFDNNLQSKLVNNLYACGEVLNVDGDCGGYNLFWAFLSGIIVGENIC